MAFGKPATRPLLVYEEHSSNWTFGFSAGFGLKPVFAPDRLTLKNQRLKPHFAICETELLSYLSCQSYTVVEAGAFENVGVATC
jgi:hypothetical protein